MFNATHFTYDGVYSGDFGLQIATFDGNSVEESVVLTPTVNVIKTSLGKQFLHNGFTYEEAPEYTFSIISKKTIPIDINREILNWLANKNSFRRLQIHQPNLEQYYYNCVFTNINMIYVHGRLVGYKVTAKFDSIYGYGVPRVVRVQGTGVEQTISVYNESDIVEGYVYPTIEFNIMSDVGEESLSVVNTSEDYERPFTFKGINANETIIVDNELKIISGENGGDKLSCFNYNWLRLKRGKNNLKITLNGTLKIKIPTYVLIGF